MDLQLLKKGFDNPRNKRWLLLLGAFGFSYGAYRVYHLPSVAQKRRRVLKLLGVLFSLAEAVSDSAEAIGVVSRDLKDFLQSKSDKIPNSLKQVSKFARSNEFLRAVTSVTQALTLGILRGYRSKAKIDGYVNANAGSSYVDQIFDKLFTSAGSGFASVVVGSFARNLVMGFFSDELSGAGLKSNSILNSNSSDHVDLESDSISKWVNVVCDDKYRKHIGDCIQVFVSTAVAVYLEKTMDVNVYDEIFAGLTNPKHQTKVRDVMVSVCNGAIETLVKTSHQVMTTSNSDMNSTSGLPYLLIDQGPGGTGNELSGELALSTTLEADDSLDEVKDVGWVTKVSSTLAAPGNRRLVLDVTGRVTFETVRSFLEFLLEKIYDGIRTCVTAVREAVVGGSLEVIQYVTVKSSVIVTQCFSSCLHILDGAWIVLPA